MPEAVIERDSSGDPHRVVERERKISLILNQEAVGLAARSVGKQRAILAAVGRARPEFHRDV
jgi:hypothetical protein